MGKKKTAEAEEKPEEVPAKPKEPEADKEEDEDPPLVKALKVVDDKYLELQREYEKELHELEKRYDERRAPLLEERTKLLTEASGEEAKEGKGTPALDGFWLQAMKNHPSFEDKIEEWDEPVLEYLRDITRTNIDPEDMTKGFKLTFHFVENPYFANDVLWKEYYVKEVSPYTGDMEATEIKASAIDWKPGKNVTVETIKKKVKGGGAKKQKQKNKETEEPRDSFFRAFFRNLSPDMPVPDDIGDMGRGMESDEEDEDFMEELMDDDYNCGQDVRDTLIPYAVRWYTGEARPDDDEDDEDEEEEEDDDYEDDDEDSDDQYQPPPKKAPPKKKGSGGGGGGGDKKKDVDAGGGQKPEECKQQ